MFFQHRRARVLCLLGALLIAPSLDASRKNVDYHKKSIEEELTYLGRLELLKTLLYKWWSEPKQ